MGFDKTQPLDPQVALLQKLRDLRRQEDEEDVESTAARTRWLDAVEGLLVALRSWLQPAAAEGLARVDAASVHVADDDVGAYDAPALKIAFPGSKILWVRPVGTLRVGGQGIVDIVCGSNRALLVLNRAGVWKIRGPAPTGTLAPLDYQTFSRAVGELLS
jgi:hypothetical protein